MAFGEHFHVIDAYGVTDRYNNFAGYQNMSAPPGYFLTDRNSLKFNESWRKNVIAENTDFVLIKVADPRFIYLSKANPDSIEDWGGKTGFWINNEKTIMNIISSENAQVVFSADFIPGPSIPETAQRSLEINFPEMDSTQVIAIDENVKLLLFTVKRGENIITFSDIDIPTLKALPNGDPRVLLLGLQNIQIKFEEEFEQK
jgi:hypothetical protein